MQANRSTKYKRRGDEGISCYSQWRAHSSQDVEQHEGEKKGDWELEVRDPGPGRGRHM